LRRERQPRVGMVVSTPERMPVGQRAVTVFRRV
jgi:nucleoid DNA-binding protein